MSTAALETETTPPPKPLPVGVNHLMTFWWLTVAAAILAVWTFWPYLPVVADKNAVVTGFGSGLFWLVVLGTLGLGMFVGYSVVKKQHVGLLLLKVGAIVGMLVGVVLFAFAGVNLGFGPLFDPVPLFVGALLALVVLLPLIFGMMALMTLGSADDIKDFFAAESPAATEGGTGQYVVPAAFTSTGSGTSPATAETIGYHQEAFAEPRHAADEPAYDAAFDAAIEEAVHEAPSEHHAERPYAETQDLATRPISSHEIVEFTELSQTDENPVVPAREANIVESSAPTTHDEGEVIDFEMAPDDEEPPEEPGRKTLRQ